MGHLPLNMEVGAGKALTGSSSSAAVNPEATVLPAESHSVLSPVKRWRLLPRLGRLESRWRNGPQLLGHWQLLLSPQCAPTPASPPCASPWFCRHRAPHGAVPGLRRWSRENHSGRTLRELRGGCRGASCSGGDLNWASRFDSQEAPGRFRLVTVWRRKWFGV